MKLLFAGDFVFPEKDDQAFKEVEVIFKDKTAIGNLEGPIIDPDERNTLDKYKYNLYSSDDAVEILKKMNFKYLSLANNHISDFRDGITKTTQVLERNGIEYFGLKNKPYCKIKDDKTNIYIFGSCTQITGGNVIRQTPINRFKPNKLLRLIKEIKRIDNKSCIILFMHWGYELAFFPQPADRKWAMDTIDAGANLVIGHHPHVMQGIENYAEGHIFYSLGNFYLPQTTYLNRRLNYKTPRVLEEMLVEYDTHNSSVQIHWISYDKEKTIIKFRESSDIQSKKTDELTPFKGYSHKAYVRWFKHQKRNLKIENKTSKYPTYIKYNKHVNLMFYLYNYYFGFYQLVRKLFIKLGIHKPYNW